MRGAHADQSGGELVKVGLADQDRSSGEQAGDRRSGEGGFVGEGWAGSGGGQALNVDVVLDREGYPPKRHRVRVEGTKCRNGVQSLGFRHQRDEDPGIVNAGEPSVGFDDRFARVATAGIRLVEGSNGGKS